MSDDTCYVERDPTVLVYSWLTKNGKLTEPLTNFATIYHFGFILGEDFSKTAKAFRHHSTGHPNNNLIWLFWLMILAVEDRDNGGFHISVEKDSNKSLYNEIVRAMARKYCNVPKKGDFQLLKKYVKGHFRIDIGQQSDVLEAIEKIKKVDIALQKKKKEKATKEVPEEKPIVAFMISYCRNKRISDPVANFRGRDLNPYADDIESSIDIVDEDDNLADEEELFEIAEAFPEMKKFPKVQLLFTPIPGQDSDDLVGYLAQFVVFDKSWNPGKTLNKLQAESNVDRLFPNYINCPSRGFPTKTFNLDKYCQTIIEVNHYVDGIPLIHSEIDLANYKSKLHLVNTLTASRAFQRLKDAGGNRVVLDNLKHNPASPVATTYKFEPETIFWYNPKKLGLFEYYFPGIEAVDRTSVYPDENNPSPMITLSELFQVRRDQAMQALPKSKLSTNNDLYTLGQDAQDIVKELQKYRPHHMFDTFKTCHDLYKRYGSVWRSFVDDEEKLEEYETYIQKYLEIQQRYMEAFADLCKLDGQVENLQIPSALKAMLLWYKKYADKHDSFTREHKLVDKNISFYGNAILRSLMQYGYVFSVVQPTYSMMIEVLPSVYFGSGEGVKGSLMVFGAQATGKSYAVTDMAKKTFIKGTWRADDYVTDAADYGDVDIEMMIRLCDEAPAFIYDEKEAKKNPARTNKKKTAMTLGRVNLKVYESVTTADGKNRRTARDLHPRQNFTEANCSNDAKPEENPLLSRYIALTMKVPDKDPCLYQDAPDNISEELKADSVEYFQRLQFMSAIISKCSFCFGICPTFEMQLWYDIKNRIIESLDVWGMKGHITRGMDKIEAFVLVQITRMATHYTYDYPGSPYYKQPFSLDHLHELQRYLYFTPEIGLYSFTLFIEEIIDIDCGNVMRAIFAYLKIEDYFKSPYELYQDNTSNIIRFKKYQNGSADRNAYNIDLNYFQFDCSVWELAQTLSPLTSPILTPVHVEGVLRRMSKLMCTPRTGQFERNGYGDISAEELSYHRQSVEIRTELRVDGFNNRVANFCQKFGDKHRKQICARLTGIRPAENFLFLRSATKDLSDRNCLLLHLVGFEDGLHVDGVTEYLNGIERSYDNIPEEDLELLFRCTTGVSSVEDMRANGIDAFAAVLGIEGLKEGYFQVPGEERYATFPHCFGYTERDIPMIRNVPLGDPSKNCIAVLQIYEHPNRVCICPMAYYMFDPNIILEAWEEAVIMKSTPPQKLVTGWMHEKSSQLLQTHNLTREYIDHVVEQYDKLAAQHGAIPRSEGIAYTRRAHADRNVEGFISEPGRPAKKNKTEIVVISKDLAYDSALRQHINAGFPIDDEVRDPEYIKRMYYEAGGEDGTLDYPRTLLDAISEREDIWKYTHLETAANKSSRRLLQDAKSYIKNSQLNNY